MEKAPDYIVLENGIQIVSEKLENSKTFALGFWFQTGTRDEKAHLNGITHFAEHIVFKKTKKRNSKKISEEIEGYGGYLNAYTTKENICFYGRGLSERLEKTFEILSEIILYPNFDDKDVENEKRVIIDEIFDILDSPDEYIFDKFEEEVFQPSTLSLPIVGKPQTVAHISKKDLENFISENFGSSNLLISYCGNEPLEKIVALTYKYLGKLNKKIIRKRKRAIFQSALDVIQYKPVSQTHYILGTNSYGYSDKKRLITNLISVILGEGSSSRLFQRLREKNGIAYQIGSFLNSFSDISVFGVYLSTNKKNISKAEDIIFTEFQKLYEGKISKKEVEKAKSYMIGTFILSMENLSNRAAAYANQQIYLGKTMSIEQTIQEIKSILYEDVCQEAAKLLKYENFSRLCITADN